MSEHVPIDVDALVEIMRSTYGTAGQHEGVEYDVPADGEIVIETLRDFLARRLPPSQSLVGVERDGTNLLPRYGWVMPWGREGSGKTSIVVDLLFHAATGSSWLNYPIARPLRVVAVVNEGVPGGLQDKLRQKIERWDGDTSIVLDNLAIYVSPWGEFTFRDPDVVAHLRSYALDFGADYVALDPLHTLGTTGAGSPQETEEFKHVLRAFGLWADLGVITSHHANKAGMVSGDWARHPDTVVHLEKDGKNPATKLTLDKARPADPRELGVPVLLNWIVETLSYERQELPDATPVDESAVLATVLDRLASTTSPYALEPLIKGIDGTLTAKREIVKRAVARREIVNLAPPAEGQKRQSYRLVLPTNVGNVDERRDVVSATLFDAHGAENASATPSVENNVGTAPTFADVHGPEGQASRAAEPKTNVDEAPTFPDVHGDPPVTRDGTSNVAPPVRRATFPDVHSRGEIDADDNPLLR